MVVCPKCNETVEGLVKRYEQINTLTGKGQAIELEKSVCETCVQELFIEVVEMRKKELEGNKS